MSYKVISIETLSSTLVLPKENIKKFFELDLYEGNNPCQKLISEFKKKRAKDKFSEIKFDADFAIEELDWPRYSEFYCGEDEFFEEFCSLTVGELKFIATGEDGCVFGGIIRDGKFKKCGVKIELDEGPEK